MSKEATKEQASEADRRAAEVAAQEAFDAAMNQVRSAEIGLVEAAHRFAKARRLDRVRLTVEAGAGLAMVMDRIESAWGESTG